jgi:rRNA maturation RNase YbeY
MQYLNHDTLTDIISFDYTEGDIISGDIFVSIERVKDNANDFNVAFDEELKRVLAHGVLHYCGYKDKTDNDALLMRSKEEEKIKLFHVEL